MFSHWPPQIKLSEQGKIEYKFKISDNIYISYILFRRDDHRIFNPLNDGEEEVKPGVPGGGDVAEASVTVSLADRLAWKAATLARLYTVFLIKVCFLGQNQEGGKCWSPGFPSWRFAWPFLIWTL